MGMLPRWIGMLSQPYVLAQGSITGTVNFTIYQALAREIPCGSNTCSTTHKGKPERALARSPPRNEHVVFRRPRGWWVSRAPAVPGIAIYTTFSAVHSAVTEGEIHACQPRPTAEPDRAEPIRAESAPSLGNTRTTKTARRAALLVGGIYRA